MLSQRWNRLPWWSVVDNTLFSTPLLFNFLLLVWRFSSFFAHAFALPPFVSFVIEIPWSVCCMFSKLCIDTHKTNEMRNAWNKHHSRKYTYSEDIRDMNSNWFFLSYTHPSNSARSDTKKGKKDIDDTDVIYLATIYRYAHG